MRNFLVFGLALFVSLPQAARAATDYVWCNSEFNDPADPSGGRQADILFDNANGTYIDVYRDVLVGAVSADLKIATVSVSIDQKLYSPSIKITMHMLLPNGSRIDQSGEIEDSIPLIARIPGGTIQCIASFNADFELEQKAHAWKPKP